MGRGADPTRTTPRSGVVAAEPPREGAVELDLGLARGDLQRVVAGAPIRLSQEATVRMGASQDTLSRALAANKKIYGIHTGLGDLSEADAETGWDAEGQREMIGSHSCGVGSPLGEQTVRAALALRAANLARGHSAVRPAIVEFLCELLNRRVIPVVPNGGSVGASGDPILLAHVAGVMIGEGRATVESGPPLPARSALESAGLTPVALEVREGLALVNGLDFSLAASIDAAIGARRVLDWANAIAALVLEAFIGSSEPFLNRVQSARGTGRHLDIADLIRDLTRGSDLIGKACIEGSPQDPYSLRCIPQVHGATTEALDHVERIIDVELAATIDNPLAFPEVEAVHHCGHFHGQALALACDYLALALAGQANISHARSSLLLRGRRGLPKMLSSPESGDSLMMLETVSASLLGRARAMAAPVSVHNVMASPLQEDHVSMAWEAARRTGQLTALVSDVLAIEAIEAVVAAGIRGRARLGRGAVEIYDVLGEAQAGAATLTDRIGLVGELIRSEDPPITQKGIRSKRLDAEEE